MFSNENPKSFQSPKVGPQPQQLRAHFVCMTPLCRVSKNQPKNLGPPLTKSWIRPCNKKCILYLAFKQYYTCAHLDLITIFYFLK